MEEKKLLLYTALFLFTGCTQVNEKNTAGNRDTPPPASDTQSLARMPNTTQPVAEDSTQYLFNIEGNYALERNDASCKMELTIFKNKKQLEYRLKTNTRHWQGDVEVTLNEKRDGYYITFKNIEWSEYEGGALPDENDTEDQEQVALPQEVQGVLYKNEITIQNTGNAMNYYVKFGDCNLKYIRLVKTKLL